MAQMVVISDTGLNWRTVTSGVPQGSVRGVILLSIVLGFNGKVLAVEGLQECLL